jgi:hypothetical protein
LALVPGFDHDVFVSYAHADDLPPMGHGLEHGWVTTLVGNLDRMPGVTRKAISIDHQLKPGDPFNADLRTKVERSALLLILLSQNYVDSEWCGIELDHFIRTHADDPAKPRDVFVVELRPFNDLSGAVPQNVRAIRKELIHAVFWRRPEDSASPLLVGYPTPKPDDDLYWQQISELAQAVDDRLRVLKGSPPRAAPYPSVLQDALTASTSPSTVPPGAPKGEHPCVLLADVTDDIVPQREALKIALRGSGIAVLPEGDYAGHSAEEFKPAFDGDLKRSSLFVQLLSTTVGRTFKGFEAPLPQLQFARAREAGIPILQWCEALPAPGSIPDAGHQRLFDTPYLHKTNLERFKDEVIEKLRHDEEARRARAALPTQPAQTDKRFIFVDDACGDSDLSRRVREIIKREHCQIRSLPANASLGANGFAPGELMRPCRGALTLYTDRRTQITVQHRLAYFINRAADEKIALTRWGVYFGAATGTVDVVSEFGIDSDDVVPVRDDEQALVAFVRSLWQ